MRSPAILICAASALLLASSGHAQTSEKAQGEKKQEKPAGKKAELPKLPPNKRNALEELLRKFDPKDAKTKDTTQDPKADQNAKPFTTKTPATGSMSKLDRINAIVEQARKARLAKGEDTATPLPPNPFVGTWAVSRIVRKRMFGDAGRGWVIFTPTYMSMHLFVGASGQEREPRWQSSMRRYAVQGPLFITQSLVGLSNAGDGESILLEQAGRRESRRFQFLSPNVLRIMQGANRYLELRRVERF